MIWNQKLVFRIFLAVLVLVFIFIFYFVFVSKDNSQAESFFGLVGFHSADEVESGPIESLPSGSTGGISVSGSGSSSGGGGSGGGSSVGSSGNEGSGNGMSFCTFNAYHTITSEVPCKCGFSGVCYQAESVCDATFNNGEGLCS